MEPIDFVPIKEPELDFKHVSILFLAEDIDRIDKAIEIIELHKQDEAFLASYKDFDVFFNAVLQAKDSLGIRNTATALRAMADLTIEHYGTGEA